MRAALRGRNGEIRHPHTAAGEARRTRFGLDQSIFRTGEPTGPILGGYARGAGVGEVREAEPG